MPPEKYINKDFLKQVLAEEKHLLSNNEVKTVNVPLYDELSVKNIYPMFRKDPEFQKYFPDQYPQNKGPPRQWPSQGE